MVLSVNFAPWSTLIRATLEGSQVGEAALTAYEYACDYYGGDKVALQRTELPVECENVQEFNNSVYSTVRTLWDRVSETQREYLSLTRIREFLKTAYNPSYKKALFIHWPEVTVSNEHDESINIQDLFCRIPLFYKGLSFREREPFTLMRTTYTKVQWDCRYIHSHLQSLTERPFMFKHICLGSGPIRNTIRNLHGNPDNEMAIQLFFWELDKVVHVESLTGVPYYRLSSVTEHEAYHPIVYLSRERNTFRRLLEKSTTFYKDFIISFLKANDLHFGFKDGKYVLGCSFTDFAILLTNYYGKWRDAVTEALTLDLKCPKDYAVHRIPVSTYVIKDGKIFSVQGTTRGSRDLPSRLPTFKFNGRIFTLTVLNDMGGGENYLQCELLDLSFVATVYEFILTSVNTATSIDYEEKREISQEDSKWEHYASTVSHGQRGTRRSAITDTTSTLN